MNVQRALCMQVSDVASLGRLRRRSGVEVCECQDAVWLRVREITDELEADMRTLPGTRFTVLPDGQLVGFGKLVPKGQLPDDDWIELAQWMAVGVDSAALSGKVNERIKLRVVRGGPVGEPNMIVTRHDIWQRFAVLAPQVRLDRWAFASSGGSGVVVRGTPPPPVKGLRFVEISGVAVQAGWTWVPPVAPDVLSKVLGLASDDVALLYANGNWDHIRGDDFVRTTRSAVRLSGEAIADG